MLVCVGVLNSFPFAFALLSCALQLGGLAHSEGSWSEAQQYYEQALQVAQGTRDSAGSALARCNVGLVQGSVEFEQFIKMQGGGEDLLVWQNVGD
mmetsp:Transcript_10602/g.24324  ORF Transcript_10602/g.24324 Transcript_10602/m.24324 type:complete len:95 (-) Transcript_10602:239-523(-)